MSSSYCIRTNSAWKDEVTSHLPKFSARAAERLRPPPWWRFCSSLFSRYNAPIFVHVLDLTSWLIKDYQQKNAIFTFISLFLRHYRLIRAGFRGRCRSWHRWSPFLSPNFGARSVPPFFGGPYLEDRMVLRRESIRLSRPLVRSRCDASQCRYLRNLSSTRSSISFAPADAVFAPRARNDGSPSALSPNLP